MSQILNKYGRMALAVFFVTFIWMVIGNLLGVPTWPAFIIWACFYLIGASEEAVTRDIPSAFSGVLIGNVVVFLLDVLTPGLITQSVIVGLMASAIILVQENRWFISVPMVFVGLNIYFALGNPILAFLLISIGACMGLLTNSLTEIFELYL